MDDKAPPPPGSSLAERLRDMKVDGYKFFADNPPSSVRASISRLKMARGCGGRDYTTKPKDDGCEVWRLK